MPAQLLGYVQSDARNFKNLVKKKRFHKDNYGEKLLCMIDSWLKAKLF